MFQSCLYKVLGLEFSDHVIVGVGVGTHMVELK